MRQVPILLLLVVCISGNTHGQSTIHSPQVQIFPDKALLDENVSIQLKGFQPGQQVLLRANVTDHMNNQWESFAVFLTDKNGQVNTGIQKPLEGTYADADSTGFFWSMKSKRQPPVYFNISSLHPLKYYFTAIVDSTIVASAIMERLIIKKGIIRIPVIEQGLAGVLFLPDTSHAHPGLIVLGGSQGGLPDILSASYASRGIATLALAYFKYEHLPAGFVNIPLEYFGIAIHWMQQHKNINAQKIGILGGSKGAEAALLVAVHYPAFKAVVAKLPSAVVWDGIWGSDSVNLKNPSWTFKGKPLPTMRPATPEEKLKSLETIPVKLANRFLIRLSEKDQVKKAMIPVEKIKAPILLVSAQQDHMIPSSLMSEMILKRLKAYQFSYKVQHLDYKGAGHRISVPNLPTTVTGSARISSGGNAKDNAWADADSWRQILNFLRENLK